MPAKIINHTLAAAAGALLAVVVMKRGDHSQAMDLPATPVRAAVDSTPVVSAAPPLVEFTRLEKENADLRARLSEAAGKLAERDATLTRTSEQLAELRRPMTEDILSSTLRAEMKSGEAIVTGGYRLPDGRRLYAFATPVVEPVDGQDNVRIEGRYFMVTEAAGKSAGLDTLATNAANTLQHGEVWVADEQRAVLAQLAAAEGTDMVAYPSASVRPGLSAVMEAGGIQLKVTPELSADRTRLNVELRIEQAATAISPVEPPVSSSPASPAVP